MAGDVWTAAQTVTYGGSPAAGPSVALPSDNRNWQLNAIVGIDWGSPHPSGSDWHLTVDPPDSPTLYIPGGTFVEMAVPVNWIFLATGGTFSADYSTPGPEIPYSMFIELRAVRV